MISKVMIKFRSKFQFQISLQFYRTVEKVETCAGNVNFLHKNGLIPLWFASHLITSTPPLLKLYALPSPINMTTMIKQNTKFPPTARSLGQTGSPGYSLPHS